MKYYIGIDGGGTKTAVCIGKDNGTILKTIEKSGSSYKSIGIDNVVNLLSDSVREITQDFGVSMDECVGCCIGLPCYGEEPASDIEIKQKLEESLCPIPVHIVNDAEVGWAGSLECKEGIHIVAGTGAMAYARSDDGREARSNGWSEFFSDEGSCYWIGKEAMSLFAKESDERCPRGALYKIIREELGIENDVDFINIIEKDYAPYREKVASFQLFAKKAAEEGDGEAKKLYKEAAQHLADSALGIIRQLGWENKSTTVSYFGGLFKVGDLILDPLKDQLRRINCTLIAPKHSALEGALLLGIKTFK